MKKDTVKPTNWQKRMDLLIRLSIVMVIAVAIFFFAVRPMVNKDYYFNSNEEYTFDNLGSVSGSYSYDVAVIGDGPDGISAAIGAARVGAKTLLVCSAKDLGNEIIKSYNVNWSTDVSPTGVNVSADIFKEIRHNAEEGYNIYKYADALKKMVSDEKRITVLYDAQLENALYENGKVVSADFKTGQGNKNITAKRFIDATKSGDLLKICKVPFSSGYSNIGIDGLYPPVTLGFMVTGVDYASIAEMLKNQAIYINKILESYRTGDKDISIEGLNISDQGESRVIVQSVTVKNVDLSDTGKIDEAYSKAAKECTNLYEFLKLNVEQFKNSGGMKIADEFSMPSAYHFKGSYSLTLTDVLTGKRFSDRISTASRPVTMTLEDGNGYILCNPKAFYIPLRALIPEGLNNVLMTGDKASYSPLVQTAISSNSSIAGTGFSAGVIAAYSISRNMSVPQIGEDQNIDVQSEIERTLRRLGVYMSDVKEEASALTDNWSFSYIEKLNNLGLLSAGITNDFRLEKDAKSEDFAYIILNGVARASKSVYNYEFDAKVRKYIKSDPLTKALFAEILLDLNEQAGITKNYYSEACKMGLIDETLQQKLKSKDILQFPEVYYAAVQFIEKKTGKTLK
ncbi:FAD dependent oxidoreductase [Ruminiclostridium sufflavum DSM 19573]|uniref:FAD dependent oxidoreductase n=1 Tax=Ruminiclostridium sufflavum DSM 19573 TaxID=1121337 RepID=A0A318XKY9_9FIRM|nr:FAD-dependent oxidoreductase [Ruminiclostridium sufflavum]PYG88193.1 FAD dependent oxidoreductase [Ruminiclostridium sufflavum DSM 19573]